MSRWWLCLFLLLAACEDDPDEYEAPTCELLDNDNFEPSEKAETTTGGIAYHAWVADRVASSTHTFELTSGSARVTLSGHLMLGVAEAQLFDGAGESVHRSALWPGGFENESEEVTGAAGTWHLEVRHSYTCGQVTVDVRPLAQ